MASTLPRFGTPHGLAIFPDLRYVAPAAIRPAIPIPTIDAPGVHDSVQHLPRPHNAQVRVGPRIRSRGGVDPFRCDGRIPPAAKEPSGSGASHGRS